MSDMKKARIAEALRILADAIEHDEGAPEWYDQKTSPLGRRRHLELVREGKLAAVKDGRRVLVRRDHIDAFLAARSVVRVGTGDEDTEAERLLERLKRKAS